LSHARETAKPLHRVEVIALKSRESNRSNRLALTEKARAEIGDFAERRQTKKNLPRISAVPRHQSFIDSPTFDANGLISGARPRALESSRPRRHKKKANTFGRWIDAP